MLETPSTLSPNEQSLPVKKLGMSVQFFLAGTNAACWLAIIPLYQLLLPLQVAAMDPRGKIGEIALLTFLAGITALFSQPLIGALSDRTSSRFGRRKPWMVAGMLFTVGTLLALALARNLLILTLALAGFGFTMNMLLSALMANIPDRVPVVQRATVSAIFGLAQPVGTLIGLITLSHITHIVASYSILAGTLCVAVIAFSLWVPEQSVPREALPPFAWKSFLMGFVRPLARRDFLLAWLARFWTIAAQTLLATYMLFYLQDAHILPASEVPQGVALFQLLQTVSLVVTSLVAGWLSDRFQRRKVFVLVAGVMMTLAFLWLAFFPSWSMVLGAGTLFGAGFGIFVSGDLALSTQVLPDASTQGRDMGIITAGAILPELLFPLVAWLAFSLLNGYPALFLLCAAACLLGALCVLPVQTVR